jgi:hypothetical protein
MCYEKKYEIRKQNTKPRKRTQYEQMAGRLDSDLLRREQRHTAAASEKRYGSVSYGWH